MNRHRVFGFTPLLILITLAVNSSLAVGGFTLLRPSPLGNSLIQSNLSHQLKTSPSYLDQYKLLGARVLAPAVGTVVLPDGSFSSFRIYTGQVVSTPESPAPTYTNNVKFSFPSGDISIDSPQSLQFSRFILKDGSVTSAKLLDHLSVALLLPSGKTLPIKILSGSVSEGLLTGPF